jgi:RNA polymerase sigma-70 factor (ECF subfamily)
MTERQLLDAARAGDEDAYERLVAAHRRELHAHCYRMLGSSEDAEDALQEALLRAWRGLPRFEGRSSVRSWLYRIATNACLRLAERRRPLVLPIDHGPPWDPHDELPEAHPEPIWLQPLADAPDAYEARESVELAFVAALQHLPARQRAVLILRDVLGFSGTEVAAALDTSRAAVDSALQRAHATIDARLPAHSQQATLRALGDAGQRQLTERFTRAWDAADVDAIVALLTDDAAITMPPYPSWYRGRDAIAAFLRRGPFKPENRWRTLPATANGQLAVAGYLGDGAGFAAHSVHVLELAGDRIAGWTAFIDGDLVGRFGLPARLQEDGTPRPGP